MADVVGTSTPGSVYDNPVPTGWSTKIMEEFRVQE